MDTPSWPNDVKSSLIPPISIIRRGEGLLGLFNPNVSIGASKLAGSGCGYFVEILFARMGELKLEGRKSLLPVAANSNYMSMCDLQASKILDNKALTKYNACECGEFKRM
jgi:hypothetical protein